MSTPSCPPLVVAVIGPTATGKSDLAVALAQRFDGEVVNADAYQLYRGMDVGTAKLTPAQRRGIPHHQLDVLEVTQEASLAAYQRQARADLDAIATRGRLPILAGGSGLYVRAALDRLDIPPTDARVRAELEQQAATLGAAALHARLAERDPVAAAGILPSNARRIVRALEVIELTGRPFSASMPDRTHRVPTLQLGLDTDRAALDARIAQRCRRMWAEGLLDEVTALRERGLERGRTAAKAVGYVQALAQARGELTQEQAIESTVVATRRLVRRQASWFRPDQRIVWLDAGDPATALTRAAELVGAELVRSAGRGTMDV